MRIVFAVHHLPPRYTGGAELRTLRTASQMRGRGHEVEVICVEHTDRGPEGGVAWEDGLYDGIPVRRLSFDLAAVPDRFRWEYDNVWIGVHLRQYLAERAPDLFHLIGGYLISGRALRVAQEMGIPTVLTLTDFWFLCPRIHMWRSDGRLCQAVPEAAACVRCMAEERRRYRLPGRIAPGLADVFWRSRKGLVDRIEARRAFLLEVLDGTDCIVSPSQFLRQFFVRAGVVPEKVVFIRQGRDFPTLRPEDLNKPASPCLRVGYIGQIAPHKGIHVLFAAARLLAGAPLQVRAYGDTSGFPRYVAGLRRLIRGDGRMGLNGAFSKEMLSRVLRELDVVVVPSLWYENSPNVILEAFAHCTPVIVSNVGGMAEMVEDGVGGLRFRRGDVEDLTRQLQRLLDRPALLEALREGIPPVKRVAEEMDELKRIYVQVQDRGGGT